MATLIISHHIYLNREQRLDLHKRLPQDAIGVSVPVWFQKGNTSEPAQEIFCKYQITNDFSVKAIIPTEDGYVINIPQKVVFKTNGLSEKVQDFINGNISTSDKLLDVKDGGSESIEFRHFGKITIDEKTYSVIHFVEIKTEKTLFDTLS